MNDIYPLLGTFTIFLNFQLYVFHNGSGREGKTVTKGRKHNFLFFALQYLALPAARQSRGPTSGDILALGHSVSTLPHVWRVYGEPYGDHKAFRVWGLAPVFKILTG